MPVLPIDGSPSRERRRGDLLTFRAEVCHSAGYAMPVLSRPSCRVSCRVTPAPRAALLVSVPIQHF